MERRGDRLEIAEVDAAAWAAWQRDGLKLERLHGYWFHRAVDTYVEQVAADRATWIIGRPENVEANRLAWVRALQAQLRLREAYGVADEVASESGDAVDLFRALLSLNLRSAFFQQDLIRTSHVASDFLRQILLGGRKPLRPPGEREGGSALAVSQIVTLDVNHVRRYYCVRGDQDVQVCRHRSALSLAPGGALRQHRAPGAA